MGYKVTNPVSGVWHYEYALYNQNSGLELFNLSVCLWGVGANISNIGFHHPAAASWLGETWHPERCQGYSRTPWTPTQTADSITWSCGDLCGKPKRECNSLGARCIISGLTRTSRRKV